MPKKTLVPRPVVKGARMCEVDSWSPVMEKYRRGEKDICEKEQNR